MGSKGFSHAEVYVCGGGGRVGVGLQITNMVMLRVGFGVIFFKMIFQSLL